MAASPDGRPESGADRPAAPPGRVLARPHAHRLPASCPTVTGEGASAWSRAPRGAPAFPHLPTWLPPLRPGRQPSPVCPPALCLPHCERASFRQGLSAPHLGTAGASGGTIRASRQGEGTEGATGTPPLPRAPPGPRPPHARQPEALPSSLSVLAAAAPAPPATPCGSLLGRRPPSPCPCWTRHLAGQTSGPSRSPPTGKQQCEPSPPSAEQNPAWMGHGAHRLPGTLDVRPYAWGRRDPQECPFRGETAPVPAACIAKCRSTFPGRLPAGAGLPLGVVSGSPGPRGARPLGWHVHSTTLCPGTCPRHLWAAPGLAAARWSGLRYGRRPLASALPASPCRGRDGAPGAAVSKPAGPGRPARGRPGRRAGDRGLPAPAITERPGRRAPRDPPRPLHLLLSTSRTRSSSVFPGPRREAFPGP